jgi:hypothetical protein
MRLSQKLISKDRLIEQIDGSRVEGNSSICPSDIIKNFSRLLFTLFESRFIGGNLCVCDIEAFQSFQVFKFLCLRRAINLEKKIRLMIGWDFGVNFVVIIF